MGLERAQAAGLHWQLIRTEFGKSILILAVLAVLGSIIWVFVGTPALLSQATVRSERLSFSVINPRMAAMFIQAAKVQAAGVSESSTVTGLLTPTRGATVTYARSGRGPLLVTITAAEGGGPAATLEAGKPARSLASPIDLEVQVDNAPRLPVWGRLTIGQEFRPTTSEVEVAPTLLIDGDLKVLAHAILTGTLYSVTSIPLPVGGRLEASAPEESRGFWWGTVQVGSDKTALEVNVATEEPRLTIYRPNRSEPDVVEMTWLVQLSADPVLLHIQFVMGFVILAFKSKSTWSEMTHKWRGHKAEET